MSIPKCPDRRLSPRAVIPYVTILSVALIISSIGTIAGRGGLGQGYTKGNARGRGPESRNGGHGRRGGRSRSPICTLPDVPASKATHTEPESSSGPCAHPGPRGVSTRNRPSSCRKALSISPRFSLLVVPAPGPRASLPSQGRESNGLRPAVEGLLRAGTVPHWARAPMMPVHPRRYVPQACTARVLPVLHGPSIQATTHY